MNEEHSLLYGSLSINGGAVRRSTLGVPMGYRAQLCFVYIWVGVCLTVAIYCSCPWSRGIAAVVYSSTLHHCPSLLLYFCYFLYTYLHTHTLFILWSPYEWLLWMDVVTVGTADVLIPSMCGKTHTHTHAHSHLAVCSLAYILSLSSPRPHVPLTHNALLPPRPGSISHAWCQ